MAPEFFRITKNPLMPFHVKRLKNGNQFSRRRHRKDETARPRSDRRLTPDPSFKTAVP